MVKNVGISFAKVLLIDLLLLIPAVAFWICAALYVTLGTDWLFESVVAQLGITKIGNAVLIFWVVICPAIVIATNGMHYMISKNKAAWAVLSLASVLLMLGFFAVLRKG